MRALIAGVLWLLGMAAGSAVCAQRADSVQVRLLQVLPAAPGDLEATPWQQPNGLRLLLPALEAATDTWQMEREFFLPRQPSDTLYVYTRGVVGGYSWWLNGTLMYKGTGYGFPQLLVLPPAQQRWQWNRLVLQLHPLPAAPGRDAWQPAGICGVYDARLLRGRPGSLLPGRDTAQRGLPLPGDRDTVMVWLPWEAGKLITVAEASARLQAIRRAGFRKVYTPLGLPPEYAALYPEAGLLPVGAPGAHPLGWQAYPLAAPAGQIWWHTADGRRTAAYDNRSGLFAPVNGQLPRAPAKWQLLVIMLVPLLFVLLWKLQSPKDFRDAMQLGNVRTRFSELSRELNFFQKTENPRLPQFVRLMLLASLFSGIFIYLYAGGLLGYLQVFGQGGLLRHFVQLLGDYPVLMFMCIGLVLLLLLGIRQLTFAFLGLLYGIRNLGGKVSGVELAGAYPQLLLVAFVPHLLLLGNARMQPLLLGVLLILLAFHVLRRLVVQLNGLQQVLQLPGSLIILYICALEILPWLLLL
ncbi:MAG: DUF4271 domain-containing protein [Bacteroidetes bacterium]|nr:DUF4271 domain-containing protein [Bacteroidota bacterium]